ncbi:MAG: hypothetical protein WD081_00955 [Gammaproteobacteria bacterium]
MFKRLCVAIVLTAAPPLVAAQTLPDPTERTSMARAATAQSTPTQWTLQSTLIAADRRVAVINGETVTVGSTINGARVLEINPYGVRLRTAGGAIELKLTGADPKRAAGGGS